MHTRRRGRKSKKELPKSFLGEGFFGKTYKVGHGPRNNAFSNVMIKKNTVKITLYKEKGEHVLRTPEDIQAFMDFLYSSKEYIVKLFKNKFFLTGVTVERAFKTELAINRSILKHYGNKAEEYLAITPVKGFKHIEFLGTKIEADGDTFYAVYSVLCNNKYDFHFKKFLKDIAESIGVLQASGFQHNDIKLDNVVLCKDRYKLIDWGQVSSINEFRIGDMICTSPIKWYTRGLPKFFSKRLMKFRERVIDRDFEKSHIFHDINERISDEFNRVVKRTPDKHTLFLRYKKTFDIFMLGMTLVHGVYKFSLNYETYKPIIYALTSLENPISDVKDVMKLLDTI